MRAIKCAYCGAPADTHDHVIPKSYTRGSDNRKQAQKGTHREGEWVVPACRECNTHLGDRFILNVPARAAFLLARFRNKWAKLLRSPDWTTEEMEEVEGFLRKSLEAQALAKLEAKARLDHLELIASMAEDFMAPEGDLEEA